MGSAPSNGSYAAFHCFAVTSKTPPNRFEAVSSGPKIRKFSGLARMTSASQLPRTRVASATAAPRASSSTSTAKSRKSGRRSGVRRSPPLVWGFAPIRR